MKRSSVPIGVVLLAIAMHPRVSQAQSEVDENVVYGTLAGLALTMDVYYPDEPNHLGILFVPGSGWNEIRPGYAALATRALPQYYVSIKDEFVGRGFAVFVANYRLAPVFRYPAAIEDLRRAVRFIRANSDQFGIEPESLGAVGHSAGGHLVALLAAQDGDGDSQADDPVEAQSAKPSAVVTIAGVYDFTSARVGPGNSPAQVVGLGNSLAPVVSFLGELPTSFSENAADASPVEHLSADDPPFLIIHGRADPLSPFEQADFMRRMLEDADMEVRFVPSDDGHGPLLDMDMISGWLTERLTW